MGLDFSALIHYPGPNGEVSKSIARLEDGEEDAAIKEVVACGKRNGFAFANHATDVVHWRSLFDYKKRFTGRPDLPSRTACLSLTSDFHLMFAADVIWVYHTLRWRFFVTEIEWQRIMLGAISHFCQLFSAIDCIITYDQNRAVNSARDGMLYSDALVEAERGEGEVETLDDLYRETESTSELVMKPVDGPLASVVEGQMVQWPTSKPLPLGWVRPTIWNSKGYWRFNCAPLSIRP